MVQIKLSLVLLINFLSILKVSLLETVHFTNSPNKILRANNFTTYKVEVPNGEPITIIEANVDLIKKKIRFNNVENTKYSINHSQANKDNAMDLKTSLSMTVTPHNNNDEYKNSPSGEEESVTDDYGNLSPEHIHHQHSMKTVYSPELLQKFLKDYANKVQSTEATITAPVTHSTEYHNNAEINDKYESIEAEDDDGNRRVSSVDENKEPAAPTDIQERKHYRPGGNNNNNNNYPYNKNSGWVTLDAVPWSKSKVSKWQSSVKPSYSNQNSYNYQNSNNNNGYNRPSRPYNYDDDYNSNNNNDNDDYYNTKPSRPSYQNNQFYGSPSSQNRPPPDYSHSNHHSSSSFNSNNNYNNYDNRPNRPYQPDIITDNRPSNFPNHPDHSQQHHHDSSHHHNEYNHNRPSSYDVRPNRPPNDYHYSSSHNYNHYSNKDGPHPLTYPNGDGEWVLVSTTKGYQFPKRNGERAMLFQAQNGVDGTDTRKNDNKGIITAASQQYDTAVSIRPPYQIGPTKTTQQQVKLTVLPHFVKNENGPQKNPHYSNNHHQYNNMDVSVYRPSNYNGIIESDPSSQTIEESVAAAANANDGNSVAQSVKKKRKAIKNYAVMRKNTASDSTAMLAAVRLTF